MKKWDIVDSKTTGVYSSNDKIMFLTNSSESSLCDYFHAYILLTGSINVTGGNANTKVAFKICVSFEEYITEINKFFVDKTEHINIAMPMYKLIKYSDNYKLVYKLCNNYCKWNYCNF